MKQVFLTEQQIKYIKESMLLEGSRDNMLLPYLELVQKNEPSATMSQLKNFLMKKFVTEANIHSLSLGSNFYLCGVARYYFNGDLTENKRLNIFYPNVTDKFNVEVCQTLDEIIVYLRNLYIDTTGTKWEQPEDFGTLTIQQIFKKYYGKVQKSKGMKKNNAEEVNPYEKVSNKVGKKYTYDIMYSQEDCKKYNQATSPGAWCITYAQQHYNYYTKNNKSHFVIFLQNGYESIERKVTNGFPKDTYGLSMLAVQQSNVDGRFVGCTTRWNHGNHGGAPNVKDADTALSYEEFKKVTNISDEQFNTIFEIWKYNSKKNGSVVDRSQLNRDKTSAIRNFKYAQMLLRNGATLEKLKEDGIITYAKALENEDSIINEAINNKVAMRSVLAIETTVNDNHYWTILDRGNVLVDSILANDIILSHDIYNINISYTLRNNELLSKRLAFCVTKSGYIIFDIKTHSIITVDNNKYFSFVDMVGVNDLLLKDKQGQFCVYFLDKKQPLVLPNGQMYLESVQSINADVVFLTYDSSAKETYFYNIGKKCFIDKLNGFTSDRGYRQQFENGIIAVEKFVPGLISWNSYKKMLYNVDKDDFETFGDKNEFDNIDSFGNGKFIFDGSHIYNFDTKKPLKLPNGEIITCKYAYEENYRYYNGNKVNYDYIRIDIDKYDKSVLYDINTDKFYVNEDGTFLFKHYGNGKIIDKYGRIIELPNTANGPYWYENSGKIDLKKINELLDSGEDIINIVDDISDCDNSDERLKRIFVNGLYNVYRSDINKVISENWFSKINDFHDDLALVITSDENYINYLKKNGELLLDEKFTYGDNFNEDNHLAIVKRNYYSYYILDKNGVKTPNNYLGMKDIKRTSSPLYFKVLENNRQRNWRFMSINGNVFTNTNDAINDSLSTIENGDERNVVAENVDFYKKHKFKMSGENLSDYAHIIDEEFEKIVNEYNEDKNNNHIFLTKGNINELCEDNELTDVMNSFDLRKTLNPKIWVNGKLNSRVRLRLLDIADKFIETLNVDWVKPKDIIMTGSLANYNWSKYSDIDLHILIDFKEVDERVDFVKNYFDSKKKLWNEEHENLTIYGYPIEVYVQDIDEEHKSSGVYSLEKNKWLVEPEKDELKATKLNKKRIIRKVSEVIDKIETLENMVNSEKDLQKIDMLSNKVKELFDKIKNYRKESLKNGSEMSEGNILFKCLRRTGHIGRLVDLKSKTFDKINSIK